MKKLIVYQLFCLIGLVLALCPSWLFAETEPSQITELALFQEIPKVSIASKSDENYLDASGTVYVFTSKDFERYGWRTVADALKAIPNMDIANNYQYTDGGQRGFAAGSQTGSNRGDFSQTILLMDGRQIQEWQTGRANNTGFIPLHNIERIEVLMGPNSTLYGSHALEGVINIISKNVNNRDKAAAPMTNAGYLVGDANTQQIDFSSTQRSGDAYLGISGSRFSSDRDWPELVDRMMDSTQTRWDGYREDRRDKRPEDFQNYQRNYTAQADFNYKAFYAGGYFIDTYNKELPTARYEAFRRTQKSILYAGVKGDIMKDLNGFIEVQKIYNQDLIDSTWGNSLTATTPVPNFDSQNRTLFYINWAERWEINIWNVASQLNYKIWNNDIVGGIDYSESNNFSAHGNMNTPQASKYIGYIDLPDEANDHYPNTNSHKISPFIQDKYSLLDNLSILLGTRYNIERYIQNNLTSRAMLMYKPLPDTTLKFGYSEGFRALAFNQYQAAFNGDVTPSKMKMLEANYSQKVDVADVQLMNILAGYNMKNTDFLDRRVASSGAGVEYYNAGEQTMLGLEDMLKFGYWKFNGFVGARYLSPVQKAKFKHADGSMEEYLNSIPQFSGSFGLSANIMEWLKAALDLTYCGPVKKSVPTINPDTLVLGPNELHTFDPYAVMNFNLSLVNLDFGVLRNYELTFHVDNVLDTKSQTYLRGFAYATPQPPRSYWLMLNFNL